MRVAFPIFLLLSPIACDEQDLREHADRAASAASTQARDLADSAATAAEQRAREAAEGAGAALRERLAAGEQEAARYVERRIAGWVSGADAGSIAARLSKGASSSREVVAMAGALTAAVDGDTVVLPIYRRIDADAQDDVDRAIGDMPRTEVIDGLTVGFEQLTRTRTDEHVTRKGYLVVWREGDHLVGFVYRSRRRIDLDTLVRKAPALVRAAHQAV